MGQRSCRVFEAKTSALHVAMECFQTLQLCTHLPLEGGHALHKMMDPPRTILCTHARESMVTP